jgi:hypothetical protein
MSLFFNHLISLVDSTLQLDILADSFKSYFPRMKDFDPSNENQAMWYLSPKQQLVETILLFLTLTPMLYFLTKASSPWKVAVPSFPAKSTGSYGIDAIFEKSKKKGIYGGLLFLLDHSMRILSWIFLLATIHYKIQVNERTEDGTPDGRTRIAYLLQPCHLLNLFLCVLSVDSLALNSSWAAPLFHFYLCTMYGAILAVATPDTAGLVSGPNWNCEGMHRTENTPCTWSSWRPYEVESFWAQHVTLLALPLIWIARRRFPIYSSDMYITLWTWCLFFLIHVVVFVPVSLFSGRNINYMTAPPGAASKSSTQAVESLIKSGLTRAQAIVTASEAGDLGLLSRAGLYYRPVMGTACIGLAFLMRNVLVGFATLFFGVHADAEREKSELNTLSIKEKVMAMIASGIPLIVALRLSKGGKSPRAVKELEPTEEAADAMRRVEEAQAAALSCTTELPLLPLSRPASNQSILSRASSMSSVASILPQFPPSLSPSTINLAVSPSIRRRRNSTAATASLTPRSSGIDASVAFKDEHKSRFSNVLSSISEFGAKGASEAINAISAAISAMSPKSTMTSSSTPVISRSSATRRHSRPGSPREAVSDVTTETSEPIVAPPSSGIMAALTRQLSQAALFSAMKSKKVADEVPLPDSPTALLSPKMMTNGGGGMMSPKGGVAASQARRATMAAPVPDLTIIGSPAPINKGAPPKPMTASKGASSVLKPTVSSAMKSRNPREKIPLFSPVAI